MRLGTSVVSADNDDIHIIYIVILIYISDVYISIYIKYKEMKNYIS